MFQPQQGEILTFNKPYKWTSFDVVSKVRAKVRNRIKVKKLKVGHAGTLDPLATGVLIICLGKATKRIEELRNTPKNMLLPCILVLPHPLSIWRQKKMQPSLQSI